MKLRFILVWFALSTAIVALGAAPQGVKPPAHATPVAVSAPKPRLQSRIGASPRAVYQSGTHTLKVETNQPSVNAVRTMAPKTYEPAARGKSVNTYYQKKLATNKPTKEQLDKLNVGPFRREFVWWAWRYWTPVNRAWWAWNNSIYFDSVLWQEWLLDQEFKKEIARLDGSRQTKKPGLVPDEFVGEPTEAIYSDGYIDAIYNPELTEPSIVVDSSAGVQLSNLLEGSNRVFGKKTQAIGTLKDTLRQYQFIALPANFDPTYEIDVRRDCTVFVFGPSITSTEDAFGTDAPKWVSAPNTVTGPGVQVVYQHKAKAGEKFHLHGMEWSVASEQIELFSPASADALSASHYVVKDLEKIAVIKNDFTESNPALHDFVDEAREVATRLVTTNKNINDDAVTDCHYDLKLLLKTVEMDIAKSNDKQVCKHGNEFADRVKSLQDSLNGQDQLRDPSLPDATASDESVLASGAVSRADKLEAAAAPIKDAALYLSFRFGRQHASMDLFVNGKPVVVPNQGDPVIRVPAVLHPGDLLAFRVHDNFVSRGFRFAYVTGDKAMLFCSKTSTSIVRQLDDPPPDPPEAMFTGNAAKVGDSDDGANAAWTADGLPEAAEWIGIPRPAPTFDFAMTVPQLNAVAPPAAVKADNAPAADVPEIVKLLPVGSVWKPTASSSPSDEVLTVISVDAKKVEFQGRAETGFAPHWSFDVGPGGQLTLTSSGRTNFPDGQITGTVSAKGFIIKGKGVRGVPARNVDMNLTRQPPL